jgi:tetratricopeptide (TPR) repeat protein
MTTDPSVLGNAANTEVFMLLPLTAAMLASCYAVERESLAWVLVTGVCAGLALVFKQVALPNVVFHALFVTWALRRRLLVVPTLLLGLLAIPVLAGAYFALHGAWGAFLDATMGHSFAYASQLPLARYPESLWRTLPDAARSFWPLLVLAGVQAVLGCFAPSLSSRASGPTRVRRNTLLVLLWLAASFAGSAGGGYFRPHYYVQLIPPLAVLAGMSVGLLPLGPPRGFLRRAIALGLVVVPIGIGVLSNLWYYLPGDAGMKSLRLYGGPLFAQSPAVGAFIADHSDVHDTIFVLGSEQQILYYAARQSATRYIFVYPLTGPFPDARQRQLETLGEVQRNDPRFIVTVFLPSSFAAVAETPSDIFDGTRDLISRSYRVAAVLADTDGNAAAALLSGEAAAAAWQASPVWYGTPPWCALAVWERIVPPAGSDRTAADAENSLGVTLAGRGDVAEAMAHYREALRLDPAFAAAHNNLAAALAKVGQTDDAIEEYTAAIRWSPLHAEPHWNVAVLLQAAGRLPAAVEQFRAALQLNSRRPEVRYRLATTYAQAGQVREAEAELGQVLRERPDWTGAAAALAWLLATAGDEHLRDGTRALQVAEDAAQRTQRQDPHVLNSLAAAYAEVGRYADAAAVAAQAMGLARSSGQTALHDALAERLAQYRAGQPVRDRAGAPQP